MASNLFRSNAAVNAEADGMKALLDNGYLRIYTGSQPANADAAIGAVTLLAELRFAATSFGAAVAGLITANAIASVTAAANGTATWFRALKSDGTTAVLDGSVGTSGCDLNINATNIAAGATVAITSCTYQATK